MQYILPPYKKNYNAYMYWCAYHRCLNLEFIAQILDTS